MWSSRKRVENRNPGGSSIYPLHPPETRVVLRIPATDFTTLDRITVCGASIFFVGACAWLPLVYGWAFKRWRSVKDKRRRAVYTGFIVAALAIYALKPYGSPRVAKLIKLRKWKLWVAFLRYFAMEVVTDGNPGRKEDQAILAVFSHGIFPFSLALSVLPEIVQQAFGYVRPVVATATNFLPLVSDILLWLEKIDASRSSVDAALLQGDRIGLVPGGIAEIFEGYPNLGTLPDEEYSIVRKGFLRLALEHQVPVVPVYCFGSTKLFRRLNLPILTRLSSFLRASVVLFYGIFGLPIPFRQKLLYVMGNAILPPSRQSGDDDDGDEQAVDEMLQELKDELLRIFNRHKDAYGWGHKSLKLVVR